MSNPVMNNFQPRISVLNLLVEFIANKPRSERAMNQVTEVKERKEAELKELNSRKIMKNNAMGFTTYNDLLKKLQTKGLSLYDKAKKIEEDLIKQREEFTKSDIAQLVWQETSDLAGEGFLEFFNIKKPGLHADKIKVNDEAYQILITNIFENWIDLIWDQVRDAEENSQGQENSQDVLPIEKKRRRKEKDAEDAKRQEGAEMTIAKKGKKTKTAQLEKNTVPEVLQLDGKATASASTSTSTPTSTSTGAAPSTSKPTATRAPSPTPTANIGSSMDNFLKYIVHRDAQQQVIAAQQNQTPLDKAFAILRKEINQKEGMADSIEKYLFEQGCTEADMLAALSQEALEELADYLKPAPRVMFLKTLNIDVAPTSAARALPPRAPIGHIFTH